VGNSQYYGLLAGGVVAAGAGRFRPLLGSRAAGVLLRAAQIQREHLHIHAAILFASRASLIVGVRIVGAHAQDVDLAQRNLVLNGEIANDLIGPLLAQRQVHGFAAGLVRIALHLENIVLGIGDVVYGFIQLLLGVFGQGALSDIEENTLGIHKLVVVHIFDNFAEPAASALGQATGVIGALRGLRRGCICLIGISDRQP
jgi:hypothetical protein